jgi:proteasome lid subunit RPN8/RPN11
MMLTMERPFFNQMLDQLQACYPLEGCGLLAGDEKGRVTAVYPIENIRQSPTAYEMEPHQQIQAMLDLESAGWQLLAIYHSHPQGPERPSPTDIDLTYYPEVMTVIVSLRDQTKPVVRVFNIVAKNVVEKKMEVVQRSS